jgi:hypothetical protein
MKSRTLNSRAAMTAFALVLTLVPPALLVSAADAQTCKSNQYDMLQWMAPQFSTYNGHYNMVYPVSGVFYWVKSAAGFPWDVDLFDANYVYQSITEQNWNDPTTYKVFRPALPWMPRCVTKPTSYRKLSSILLAPSQTMFEIHSSCTSYTTHSLGYVVNELWGPAQRTIAGRTLETLTLVYKYSCDSNHNNCKYREDFSMQAGLGLSQWTYYTLQNGAYKQVNQTTHGAISLGSVNPVHPCW